MLNVEFEYMLKNLIECIKTLDYVKSPHEVYYLKGMINVQTEFLYRFADENKLPYINRMLANHYEKKV